MINYTPNTVRVKNPSGKDFIFPPSGIVPEIPKSTYSYDPVDGCPTVLVGYGYVFLPKDHPKQCIVSAKFAELYRKIHDRDDVELFVLDDGPTAIRGLGGDVIAVRALIRS
jgi:hypothetical protein